jgi:DNA-binding GntR family transcriptional regulator
LTGAEHSNDILAVVDAPQHGTTVAHIVQRLRDDILTRRLPPGVRLVEGELTARFVVSRGPVREALRRLAADGLIEHVPHRGALVRRLSAREIRELFEVRIELECLAGRLAAINADKRTRNRFARAIRPIFETAQRNASEYLSENAAFHRAIMELAGNRQLRDVAVRLQLPLIMAQVGDVLSAEILDVSVREHRSIAEAIVSRDPLAAAEAMRAHLERAAALAVSRSEAAADESSEPLAGRRSKRTPKL